MPEARRPDRGDRLAAAAVHDAKLALRRGQRRHPRPEHPLPHPGHRRGHPRGGPQARSEDQGTAAKKLQVAPGRPQGDASRTRVPRPSSKASPPRRSQHLTDKGQLDSEKTIALAKFVRTTATKQPKEEVAAQAADRRRRRRRSRSRSGCSTRRPAAPVADRARRGHRRRQDEGRRRHGPAELPRRRRRLAAAVQAPRRRQGQGPGDGRVPRRGRRSRPARTGRT